MSDTRYHGRAAQWDTSDEAQAQDRRSDPAASDDPLAELARLIDEDPFADFNRRRVEPVVPQQADDYEAEPYEPGDAAYSDPDYADPAYAEPYVDQPGDGLLDEPYPEDAYSDRDRSETERLYAELAAATRRVEPTFEDALPRVVRAEPAPGAAVPGGYDPARALAADLGADSYGEPRQDDGFAGDAYRDGGYREEAYPTDAALADGWSVEADYPVQDTDPAYDEIYAQTDPVFDDSGYIQPYEGELLQEQGGGRRRGMVVAAGLVGLVALGGVSALGYYMFSGGESDTPPPVIRADRTPAKIQPPSADGEAADEQPGKLVYDRVGGEATGDERLVSREEPVADVGNRQVRVIDPNRDDELRGSAIDPGAAADGDLPRRVRTVVVKPDGTIVGEVAPPQPAQPLQPAPLPGARVEPEPSDAEAGADAPAADAPATADVPLPTPRPADLPRSSDATPTASPAPLAATPPPAAPTPVASAQPNQPGAAFVPPSAPSGQPIQLQPTSLAALPAAPAPSAPAAPPPAAAPAAVAPATASFPAGSYVVQVAASRNEQDARSTASSIGQRYADALGSYAPVVERADLGDRGIYYRVGLGPLSSQGDASSLCARLKSSGLDCFVRRN